MLKRVIDVPQKNTLFNSRGMPGQAPEFMFINPGDYLGLCLGRPGYRYALDRTSGTIL